MEMTYQDLHLRGVLMKDKYYYLKNIVIFSIIFLFITKFSIFSQNQNTNFNRITIKQGLSQSSVHSIYQDSSGFLWFGTFDGLNRYDGYNFKIFRHDPEDNRSISNNNIYPVIEDNRGILWIGTLWGGLNKYDPITDTFTHYKHEPGNPESISNNSVLALVEDNDGNLWVGTEQGLRWI